jgi:carbohydrate kinase (thermoresistant glucokinase family)
MTVLILMGVSGSGKTTIAKQLADVLHWPILEGDDLHPPANIAKMSAGTPLTDEDRWPWLRAIAAKIESWRAVGQSGTVTCSALKRTYRDILVGGHADVRVVYLQGDKALIAGRLAARHGHFMPAGLLDSQFATLEEPAADEHPITVHIGPPAEAVVADILAALRVEHIAGS